MLKQIRIFKTDTTDPYWNLAIEKYLLEHVPDDTCILYLWQNQNTVVIGRNQNPWAECRTAQLEAEGGKLARRLSGGGAVFHDLGNLNFTFLTGEEHYSLPKQFSVIQQACSLLGIQTELSGRNDLLAEGRKFSGNAFYHSQGHAYHHGTLLVSADMEKLSRYLSPPKAKLESKGVASVRSRVTNLSELAPGLTCQQMAQAMSKAFAEVYGLPCSDIALDDAALEIIRKDAAHNSSWQWLYGKQLPTSFQCEDHFPWGHVQIQLDVQHGTIVEAKVYSDAMDWQLASAAEAALHGVHFTLPALTEAFAKSELNKEICENLLDTLRQQAL